MIDTAASTNPDGPALPLAIVVFGPDDKGKPHASAFKADEAELAEKAAGLMGMHVLRLDGETQRELASALPMGRVFASGRAFVPFVKRPLYEQLCAIGGHPVNATRSRKAAAPRSATAGDVFGGPAFELPLHWSAIKPGCLVLATTGGPQEGWFEAIVREDKGDDLVVCAWRDWPDDDVFLRRRNQLALLPVDGASAA